jgi:hypothetical protein
MTVVITHSKMGIYLGNCMGLGFWSLLDSAGQEQAIAFAHITEARMHIASWEQNNNPDEYAFVETGKTCEYATVQELKALGLGKYTGEMELNILRNQNEYSPSQWFQ